MNDVVTLELTPEQTEIIAPLIRSTRRKNVLLIATASPDPPNGWRFQCVSIDPCKSEKVLKQIAAATVPEKV